MPVDQKRINGPEDSIPYQLLTKHSDILSKRIDKLEQRADGRSVNEHRKIYIKTGVVSQAKGSAYIEMNKSKVIVSVFDPREIPNRPDYSLKGEIYCEFKFAPFSCDKRKLHQQDSEEKYYSAMMKQALDSTVCRHEFPNFQVDIYALVLHNDGSCLSAAITAAGLALAHAGVPMYDLITSSTVAVQKEVMLLDPTAEEQNLCEVLLESEKGEEDHGLVILSMLHTHRQVSQFYQSGSLSLEKLDSAIGVLEKSCNDIVPLIQKNLAKHVLKGLEKGNKDS